MDIRRRTPRWASSMNGIVNFRRRPMNRLPRLVILLLILAVVAVGTPATAPVNAQEAATTLVSNTHLTSSNTSDSFQAQSFETGATGGYTVSAVDIYIVTGSGKSTSVKIREDDSGEPATGDPVATLTNPGTLTDNSLNTFTASDVITLEPSTTYWISVNEGSISNRAVLRRVAEDDETGEPGWSIGNDRLFKNNETDPWTTSGNSLVIEIKGTAPPPTLVSNTHLTWNNGSSSFQAQSFVTGANTDGYTVSEVDIYLSTGAGRGTSVKIREDDGGEPATGDPVATLTNPGTLTDDQPQHVHGVGRYHAGCEHDLLDKRERGNHSPAGRISGAAQKMARPASRAGASATAV